MALLTSHDLNSSYSNQGELNHLFGGCNRFLLGGISCWVK